MIRITFQCASQLFNCKSRLIYSKKKERITGKTYLQALLLSRQAANIKCRRNVWKTEKIKNKYIKIVAPEVKLTRYKHDLRPLDLALGEREGDIWK